MCINAIITPKTVSKCQVDNASFHLLQEGQNKETVDPNLIHSQNKQMITQHSENDFFDLKISSVWR